MRNRTPNGYPLPRELYTQDAMTGCLLKEAASLFIARASFMRGGLSLRRVPCLEGCHVLGLMLCCWSLEICNILEEGPAFSFDIQPCKVCNWSCPHPQAFAIRLSVVSAGPLSMRAGILWLSCLSAANSSLSLSSNLARERHEDTGRCPEVQANKCVAPRTPPQHVSMLACWDSQM